MFKLKIAAMAATLSLSIAALTTTTSANIENCKTPADAPTHSVCVWTYDETTQFAIGARYLADGKPANSVPVTMHQTTTSAAGYTCETATAGGLALCEFAPNAAKTISIRANVGCVEFVWHNGSWR